MQRDLAHVAETRFAFLVIGAGIHCTCAACDTTLRELSVAVVDRADRNAVLATRLRTHAYVQREFTPEAAEQKLGSFTA